METIRAMAGALAAGEKTSVQIVERALACIDVDVDEGSSAYISVNSRAALAAAAASDEARSRGNVPSLLAGLPVSVKDLFDVAGEVTSAGSRVLADRPPAREDAVAVARLRAAGAILLGRTNMSEFGYSGLGLNPHYGTPLNPADVSRVVGGSSSGAAVSVALGHAAAALGTDTGGSIRIPSAFCGLTGFKPSQCRVPMTGAIPASRTLDSAGPLARSVDCCAIVDAILSGERLRTEPVPLGGIRVGICADYVHDDLDEEVARRFDWVIEKLAAAGADIHRFSFPELYDIPSINRAGGFAAADAAVWHRELLGQEEARYDPRVAIRIRRGGAIDRAAYDELLGARARLIEAARVRLRDLDAWIMPTVATVAPLVAPLQRSDATFFEANTLAVRNPSVINFLDGCALTIPCNAPGDLPIGFSVCGLQGDDARLLQIGRTVEGLISPHAVRSA